MAQSAIPLPLIINDEARVHVYVCVPKKKKTEQPSPHMHHRPPPPRPWSATEQLRLAELDRNLDFFHCDYYTAYYTGLAWWRTRQRWQQRQQQQQAYNNNAAVPRFEWERLPDRLRREGSEGGCLHALRTQMRLLEEAPLGLPKAVVRHIERYLSSAEINSLFALRADAVLQWANTLRFQVKPLYAAEAARLRRRRRRCASSSYC